MMKPVGKPDAGKLHVRFDERGGETERASTRHRFIRQQTSVINVIRAHLAELGIVAPVGRKGVEELLDVVADASDKRLPEVARACIAALGAQLRRLKEQILEFDCAFRGIVSTDFTAS